MEEKYIKKYWEEEDILFYLHFRDDFAVRQIEESSKGRIYLSEERPVIGEYMLYDQRLSDLDLTETDFITEQEFEKEWKKEK
ncbi:MAG: hypothetical protein PUB21_04715 [Bacteroidales bacterium]|nr:hypothetical protein [Bacteroidales bacterium]